ncbi:MAG: helix-turn-helix transcriptional regulator [Lentihominibacter sp.]
MAKVSVGKLKLLYILETLVRDTDQEHRKGTRELIEMLKSHGLSAERKSIYDDIETLREFGLDIIYDKEEPAGYYLGERDFELAELKLLVDAVQSSKFITARKSAVLISKLEKLTSAGEARNLQRQVYVSGRIKTMNESIYYNVDAVHSAIAGDSKIAFRYMVWNLEKQLVPKSDRPVTVSPWALVWDDENYYMIAFDGESGIMKHYRVDKMKDIRCVPEPREGKESFRGFDAAGFAKKTFGMYGGKTEKVTLECDNSLVGPILDRFGTDVIIVPSGEERFKVTQEVTVSGQFFGWIVGLGPGVRIVYPRTVADEFRDRLRRMT